METPNAGNSTAGAGRTAEQAEFEAGAQLKREGKQLPDGASEAARKGYDSEVAPPTPPSGVKGEDPAKSLGTHRVGIQAQTDRPEPTTLPQDAEPLNPNENVSITIDDPGKVYFIEGLGKSVEINFSDVTEESLLAVLIDRLDGNSGGVGAPSDNYARNAANKVREGLDWLKTRTRERLKAKGVTAASGGSPLSGGVSDRLQQG